MTRRSGWVAPAHPYDWHHDDGNTTRDELIGWGVFVLLGLAFYGALTYTRNHLERNR